MFFRRVRQWIGWLCWGLVAPVWGQGTSADFTVRWQGAESKMLARLPIRYGDSASFLRYQETELLPRLWSEGYLEAAVDSMGRGRDVYLHLGPRYEWARLDNRALAPWGRKQTPSKIGNRAGGELANPQQVLAWQKKLLDEAENRGYPFARFLIDSLQADSTGRLSGVWRWQPGPFLRFDTLALEGNLSIQGRFLAAWLGVPVGMPFSQRRLRQLDQDLRTLPYVQLVQPSRVQFLGAKAFPLLYLNKRKANQVDGVIGFLPNEEERGRLLVTGEVNLKLYNLFQTGKTLLLDWSSIKRNTQRLNVEALWPALFRSPLELGLRFNLLKEDTLFLNRRVRVSLGWRVPGGWKLGVFYQSEGSSVLARYPVSTPRLPDISSYGLATYGAEWSFLRLDDYFFPHRGIKLQGEVGLGNRTLQKIRGLDDRLYDTLELNRLQGQFKLRVEGYWPLTPRLSLLTAGSGAWLLASQVRNELYRLGGLTSLRGFNENFFFASRYGVATAELRLFTEAQSYFQLFTDWAVVDYEAVGQTFIEYPRSVGLGLTLSTSTGIFTLSYALGQSQAQPATWQNAKIHFGLTGRF